MTIRKNFNFKEETVRQLEELARLNEKTQTQILHEALEEMYKKIRIKKKLEALDALSGSLTGKIGDIDIKEERGAYLAKKYGY